MRRISVLAVLALVLLALAAPAQQHWIVDGTGGGDFTTLGAALTAASDGDVIEVRGGTYAGDAVVSKGVTLIGSDPHSPPQLTGHLEITALPVARRCVMSSFDVERVYVRDCAGVVVLDRLRAAFTGFGPPVYVSDSTSVLLRDSVLSGLAAVGVVNSELTVVGGELAGSTVLGYPYTALTASNSRVTLEGVQCRGPDGIRKWYYPPKWVWWKQPTFTDHPPGPGITTRASRVAVHSGSVSGGLSVAGQRGPAIEASEAAHLTIGDRAVVTGTRLFTGATEQVVPLPSLRATGAPPGGDLQVSMQGEPFAVAAIFVSLPGLPQPSPFGDVWLDLPTSVLIHLSVVPGTGSLQLTQPVSTVYPWGTTWVLQGVEAGSSGPPLVTNAVPVVVR